MEELLFGALEEELSLSKTVLVVFACMRIEMHAELDMYSF
jgi:hypothetical protein